MSDQEKAQLLLNRAKYRMNFREINLCAAIAAGHPIYAHSPDETAEQAFTRLCTEFAADLK